jgi:C4-dicarboxylate-specific signal transduction histidine kinase
MEPLSGALNCLQACAARLRNSGGETPELLALLTQASHQVMAAADVARRLKTFALSGKFERTSISLRGMVQRALGTLPESAGIHVAQTYHIKDIRVVVDRIQVEHVLASLFQNAVEAMTDSPVRRLRISTQVEGDRTMIRIRDHGHGLEAATRSHVFEPFFTTKRFRSGLGLAISQTIIEAHGGRLWTEDHVTGGGAVFCLTLPTDPTHADPAV